MTQSIGRPVPDCHERREAAGGRRGGLDEAALGRGAGITQTNGEEARYDHYPLAYHKALPHDVNGMVHAPSYHALVRAVTRHEEGAIEVLPIGRNRRHSGTPEDPPRYTTGGPSSPSFRKLTSPLTGHVFDTQGADAGALAISSAPLVGSDELAAEMAELYAMALLRDVPFTTIASGGNSAADAVVQALATMPWFNGTTGRSGAAGEERRRASRHPLGTGQDLFRGSTEGSRTGPWISQFLLIGSTNSGRIFQRPAGGEPQPNDPDEPSFRGTRANISTEDGFILYGTQVIDQRSIVAQEGIDWMTSWAAWLDCQNGVDFNGLDVFRERRRYLTTPRDIATYVHFDALYQGYLNACLLMLADGDNFPKSRGLPETSSRTRAAFASFGGPHVLSLVTEVATRALKAVWRQKWLHHRRARPEVVAALLTLHANHPDRITDPALATSLTALASKLPIDLMQRIAAHNTAQNARTGAPVQPDTSQDFGLPEIEDEKNYLLPMAFPEGSPTHPAYGAGHATVAGACVTVLKAMFETHKLDGTPLPWPSTVFIPDASKIPEGGELKAANPTLDLTIQGELDKLAANIAIARNMAGVHYYTDYYESLRLGERVSVSILEEQLGMYQEPVSVAFTSFDGDEIQIVADGGTAALRVTDGSGASVAPADWYGRYSV